MGFYRYLLAVAVAASHYGVVINSYNPGVVAVISFLLLSGYVMTLLIDKHYGDIRQAPLFYVDRLGRLLPQFVFYSCVTLFLMAATPLGQMKLPWMDYQSCPPALIALNFSMVANNFYWLFGDCLLIPTSWSLGLEWFFYAIAPFIFVVMSVRWRVAVAIASFAIFLAAYAGILNADIFGYRLLPGTLFLFLIGASIARRELLGPWFALVAWCAACALYTYALATPSITHTPFIKEVLLGAVIGTPAVAFLHRKQWGRWSDLFGSLSYGVFLNHVILIWCLRGFIPIKIPDLEVFALLIVASTVLSWMTYRAFEEPVLGWRRRLRSRSPQTART